MLQFINVKVFSCFRYFEKQLCFSRKQFERKYDSIITRECAIFLLTKNVETLSRTEGTEFSIKENSYEDAC